MDAINRTRSELSREQVTRIDALLDELLDLPESERLASLRERALDDATVAAEVESLLHAVDASAGFLGASPRPRAEELVADGAIGVRLGAWRMTRLVGRGGMGDVYEAVRADGDFEQRVAIKLLQRESAAQFERFQVERQILARLEHSGIARLYDGGVTEDGRPFMVMEYVEGRPITDHCRETRASFEERLRLFLQVCAAVAFAHRNLVVHRDLKPSNILVTADGTVKLLDFGIAKLLDAHTARMTHAAMAPLTPLCAAPEQLSGDPITTATDVYALGLLLFELLTGVHPWIGADTPVLFAMRLVLRRPAPIASQTAQALENPPVPVRLIRGDLDAIVAKALRKEPTHRYGTVAALDADVVRALRGEPIEARDGARLYVVGRIVRRYRWVAAAAAAVFISLAAGLGVAAWQAQRAAVERDAARRDAAREEAVRYSLTRLFRSAISDQDKQTTTAKSMIDSSAQRVLHEYHDQPQLAGELVLTLADLYGALLDLSGAAALLEGFLADASPNADPATLADARQKLANLEVLRGNIDRAALLLNQADRFWATAQRPYREERLEGLVVRARLLRAQGNLTEAIAATRSAIAERIALSGHEHRETAILFNSLAISLTAANQLDEALAAYQESLAIYRALGLADGIDAQIIVANTGTLELRTGHLQEAENLLRSGVERERALAGDSAAVAAAMGYYGKVLAITNRAEPAVQVLHEASTLAVRYAGAGSPVALQNALFLGEAQLADGDPRSARATLKAAREAALGQYGESHLLTLRAQLALAQVDAAVGGGDRSIAAQLMPVVAKLRLQAGQGQAVLAQALETLGDAYSSGNQLAEAANALREAVTIRERSPGDIWELAQARERLAETLAKLNDAGAPEMLRRAAADLESQLGASHPQTLRANAALAHLRRA